jgi:hypothetical protein
LQSISECGYVPDISACVLRPVPPEFLPVSFTDPNSNMPASVRNKPVKVLDRRRSTTAAMASISLVFGLVGPTWGTDSPTSVNPPSVNVTGTRERVASIRSIVVEPERIELHGGNRQQQVIVTATADDGRQFDVSSLATLICADNGVATVDGTVAVGVADGQSELTVSINGISQVVPVDVAGFERYPPVHFVNDVMPVLSKLGCNNGGCHGRAAGQNGFKLSVFGFDPAADYDSLVKEGRGRRIFPASPAESLLLTKPTSRVPHGGGQRLKLGSRDYQLLLEWIKQGLPHGDETAPTVVGLTVSPIDRVLLPDSEQQVLATAIYSDGSNRDVTSAALYASNAPQIVEVNNGGLIRTGNMPGEAAITVNYMGQVAAVQILAPRPGGPRDIPTPPGATRIDELVWAKLRKMGIPPSDVCDDATFFRRLHLDAIGTLPTADEVRAFLSDADPNKRSAAIETVLSRPEYADFWALKWADILLVDRQKLGDRGAFAFHGWLREQFARNRPYDEWVRELVLASGNSAQVGPANFYRAMDTPDGVARAISQSLLGVRMECAQCHHHPFEKWSQDDFYGLAGFFNGLERKPLGTDRALIYHAGYREMLIPLTNRPVPMKALDGPPITAAGRADPRTALADWTTDQTNPFFARLAANRLWKHFLGRGLVEPEDDLRSTNPATNEPLLAYLSDELTRGGYDLKAVMRQILNSRTYQLSSVPTAENADDEQNFSHYYVKRMPAEVMLDALGSATGTVEDFPGRPPGTRAIELWDNRFPSYFLEIFGRPERNTPCECGRSSEPTMAQALHLMNAPEVEQKIAASDGRVAQLTARESESALAGSAAQSVIIEELCLTALGRPPRDKELRIAHELFAAAPPRQAAEDFLWTLLNSYDFLFIQ